MRDVAAIRKAVQNVLKSPDVASVHVPVPLTNKKPRRRQVADAVTAVVVSNKFALDDPGTYVGRQVLNADQLTAWWQGVRKPGEPDLDPNPHVTVAYSLVPFDWTADPGHLIVQPSQLAGFKVLGADMAVVLKLDAPALESRWNDTKTAGALWSHPSYQPHVTLFYLGAGYDGVDWRDGPDQWPAVPDFPLVIGPELVGPRGTDVFEVAKAPSWYVPPARS